MMDKSPETVVPMLIVWGGLVFLVCGLMVLATAANRISRGLPVLPYVRRRPVPWTAFHVGVIAAGYVVLNLLAQRLVVTLFELPLPAVSPLAPEQASPPHPLVVLLSQNHTLSTLLLCVLSAVIVAPIVEEFLFRLVLQGWLEAVERRRRRQIPPLRRLAPGAVPVVLSSLLFAGIHYRSASPQVDPQSIAYFLGSNIAASLLVLAFGVACLRWDAGADAEDLGVVPERFLADGRLGVLAFVAFGAAVYLFKILLGVLECPQNVADPVALFPFALLLGVLYCRTHRLVPCIALHMSLNAVSLAIAWVGVGTG